MSAVIIRPEEPQDRDAIRALLLSAFGGEVEARLVEALRAAGDVVLSLVAERDGAVRGHILFSRLMVRGEEDFPAVALAPLAVDPAHQREGNGTALVKDAHLRFQREGELLCVVLGDPAYYGRFGFAADPKLTLDGVPPDYFMRVAFSPVYGGGTVSYHPGFYG